MQRCAVVLRPRCIVPLVGVGLSDLELVLCVCARACSPPFLCQHRSDSEARTTEGSAADALTSRGETFVCRLPIVSNRRLPSVVPIHHVCFYLRRMAARPEAVTERTIALHSVVSLFSPLTQPCLRVRLIQ